MIAMPVSGYVTSSAGGHDVSFFGLFPLPDIVPRDKALDEAASEAHFVFAWTIGSARSAPRGGRLARPSEARHRVRPHVAGAPADAGGAIDGVPAAVARPATVVYRCPSQGPLRGPGVRHGARFDRPDRRACRKRSVVRAHPAGSGRSHAARAGACDLPDDDDPQSRDAGEFGRLPGRRAARQSGRLRRPHSTDLRRGDRPRSVDRRGVPRRHHGGRRPRSRRSPDDGAAALLQRLPGAPGLSPVALASQSRAGATSHSACRASPRRRLASTSIPPRASAGACSSTTRLRSWSARRR